MITPDLLRAIMPNAGENADVYAPLLERACVRFGITTPRQRAMFLAQIAHESGELRYVRELASGAAYDTGRLAAALGNTPQADGDGQKYKGRGLIQITGRANYKQCSEALYAGKDDGSSVHRLLDKPELLEVPIAAAFSAAWFWQSRKLNPYADRGDLRGCTKRINGGLNGLADRQKFWKRAVNYIAGAD